MADDKDGKTPEESILLTTDIFSEDFDEESDDELEETQINKPTSEKLPPEQNDPNILSISIDEERPKYETEKKKKEFSSFIGRPHKKKEETKSESFDERIHKGSKNPVKRIRKQSIHTPVKKKEIIGLEDLRSDRKKTNSTKIRTDDPLQKKEFDRKKEKVNSEKKTNSGLSLIEKRKSKRLSEDSSKKAGETRRLKRSESLSDSKPLIAKTGDRDPALMKINESKKKEYKKKDTEKRTDWKNRIEETKISRTSVTKMTAQKSTSEKKNTERESLTYIPKKKEDSRFGSDMMNAQRKKKADNGMKIDMMGKKHE
jgi:hypothetical protein